MLDRMALALLKPGITRLAQGLAAARVHADQVTVLGFAVLGNLVFVIAFASTREVGAVPSLEGNRRKAQRSRGHPGRSRGPGPVLDHRCCDALV